MMNAQEQGNLLTTLKEFRRTHPVNRVMHCGKTYEYLVGGRGEKAMLLLPGGLALGEPFFLHILDLEQEYKLIALSYPDVSSFDELAKGVNCIVEAEDVHRYIVVGQSAGGVLAQVLLRKYPAKIDRAVLAHTTAVTSETSQVEIQERVTQLRKRLRLMQRMPFFITKWLSTRGILGIVETVRQDEQYFWKPYFAELVRSRTKKQGIAMMQMLIDFAENYRFTAHDLRGWAGKIMVIDSDADTSIPQIERENVRKLYPGARVHTFQDLGHLAILSERSRYLTLIREFLSS